MTTRNPVVWSEGLFVKPQHFQQTTRYLEHYINTRHGSRYWYGLPSTSNWDWVTAKH